MKIHTYKEYITIQKIQIQNTENKQHKNILNILFKKKGNTRIYAKSKHKINAIIQNTKIPKYNKKYKQQ